MASAPGSLHDTQYHDTDLFFLLLTSIGSYVGSRTHKNEIERTCQVNLVRSPLRDKHNTSAQLQMQL